MDEKFKFGGTIGYGDSNVEFLFCQFKVFGLHAILHDAAGAVRVHSGKGSGYCYMIGRGPNSCLLGHVNVLLYCFYVKFFLPSIFNSVNFRSSMSCNVPDVELADKNLVNELEVSNNGKFQVYSFRYPKKYKPTKKRFGAQEDCTKSSGTEDVWITVSFQTFFLELKRVNKLRKEQKSAKFLAIYWIKGWKTWKVTAVPKFKISLMKKLAFARVTLSNTRPHFTVQSGKQNCLVTG